jgi:transaldolase
MHEADRMAKEKLAEGIATFAQAQSAVEALLGDRL